MSAAACWMPADSLRQERAVRPVARLVEDWAAVWFPENGWRTAGAWQPREEIGEVLSTLREAGSWSISGEKGAVLNIACAMLGEAERTDFTAADLRLLRRIAGEALDELEERLAAALPKEAGAWVAASGESWALELALNGKPCLELSLDRNSLNQLVRGTYRPSASRTSLDRVGSAVDRLTVPLAGRLGSSTLQLSQIGGLEPGDILLLDQVADEPITLMVAERNSPLRCTITQSSEALSLTLCDLDETGNNG